MLRSTIPTLILALALLSACSDDGDGGGDTNISAAVPTFTGAEPVPDTVVSQDDAFSGLWRTSEDVATVQAYFDDALADGDLRIVGTDEIDGGVVIRVEDPDDPATTGTIIIRREGTSTRIVENIGRGSDDDDDDDAGEDEGEASPGGLPDGYPPDVPLPSDAQVVSGSAPLVGSSQYYLVEFTSPASPADVIAHFRQALPAQGWQAGESSDDPDAFVLNFSRGADRVTVTGGASGDGTDASVTIVIEG